MLARALRVLRVGEVRRLLSTSTISYNNLRRAQLSELSNIAEVQQRDIFWAKLKEENCKSYAPSAVGRLQKSGLSKEEYVRLVEASFATFLLHTEARIASALGLGFYTIGPCGEELLAAVALNLQATDASALHYRHVATSITRQLLAGRPMDDILLDRARGFTCSVFDPVTGGKHCAIGGTTYDFLVTSTLASQAPPALGRALGIPLSYHLGVHSKFPKDAISYVSIGDGSANNAHFLAALNLAEYSQHRRRQCPLVFAISDNNLCISLRGYGWLDRYMDKILLEKFVCDGNDVVDIYETSKAAIDYARKHSKPAVLVMNKLTRRFGHAATDRQFAYMTASEISNNANRSVLENLSSLAVQAGMLTYQELVDKYEDIWRKTEHAFEVAVKEPKITSRSDLIYRNQAPIQISMYASEPPASRLEDKQSAQRPSILVSGKGGDVMRKHMTKVFDELLEARNDLVYLGEDVRHGGYYLVTDGLASKYPLKVHDFPPDETTLFGAAMGFSQVGLTPVVEIPYAKYLDCASDMFFEGVIMNWLSDGKQTNGMVIRLQGFDKGKFGGNFHTHNMLSFPPGLDVVCYSNGADYARGMRYCVRQAYGGRVVMSVDSTDLLNRRHLSLNEKDNAWLTDFPDSSEEMSFDEITLYSSKDGAVQRSKFTAVNDNDQNLLIVTYGNGVPTVLEAMKTLSADPIFSAHKLYVADCPYLSAPPSELVQLIRDKRFQHILFADVCKQGAGMPLAGHAMALHNQFLLPRFWRIIGAQPTYNPLGQLLTFLSPEDIIEEVAKLVGHTGERKIECV